MIYMKMRFTEDTPLMDTLSRCRALLEDVTPLYADCGASCGGACCQSLPGELTGMLLFPGEEKYYADQAGFAITSTDHGLLLTCDGRCNRADRPLSCRLFPLLPLLREDGVKVATDQRARAVCPLARHGKDGLAAEFVAAVRQVGQLLSEDEEQRAFLLMLTKNQDELKALRKAFGR